MLDVSAAVLREFRVELRHSKSVPLSTIVANLRTSFPTVDFADVYPRSSMSPDGGILSLVLSQNGTERELPILISEKKNQGTNDLRAAEGLKPHAMGNAIERLGKNVIGFRAMMLDEGIMPFVCFGDGHDFRAESTLLDRVKTIGMFGKLNEVHVVNQGEGGQFNRGTYYFRQAPWTQSEMAERMLDIAKRSIHYYYAKYGPDAFKPVEVAE